MPARPSRNLDSSSRPSLALRATRPRRDTRQRGDADRRPTTVSSPFADREAERRGPAEEDEQHDRRSTCERSVGSDAAESESEETDQTETTSRGMKRGERWRREMEARNK